MRYPIFVTAHYKKIVVIKGGTWIYIPVLGSFPSSNVKLNHAVNITIAPRCAPDMCSVELFENLGRMICREDTKIVNISKMLARDLEKSKLQHPMCRVLSILLNVIIRLV